MNTGSVSSPSREEFCLALKAARESAGVTLADIASATKIPASLLDALERCDLRHWPKGIFRRSFFRDYARTIGLSVAETCAEFVRLFPDDDRSAVIEPAATPVEPDQASDVRLVLDSAWQGPQGSIFPRLIAAGIDAAAVVVLAALLAWLSGIPWPAVTAIVALVYFSLATALLGESPTKWLLSRHESILPSLTPPPKEELEKRGWTTDAHRVGPTPSSRFRVRIKVPD
ncbi:MAG: helix-turn-helix transcriptional regulator [Vicinamibacterales bacterium]